MITVITAERALSKGGSERNDKTEFDLELHFFVIQAHMTQKTALRGEAAERSLLVTSAHSGRTGPSEKPCPGLGRGQAFLL